MVNIAHTTPEATIIVFEDIDKENWAQDGKLASEDRLSQPVTDAARAPSPL